MKIKGEKQRFLSSRAGDKDTIRLLQYEPDSHHPVTPLVEFYKSSVLFSLSNFGRENSNISMASLVKKKKIIF